MQRQVELISAAWGLGGVDPGCADAPAVLAPLLLSRLREYGIPTLPGPILRPSPTERRKQVAVSRLCSLLAAAVADSLRHGRLPCVLGGDHTCAGGTWTGVARSLRGDLGLGRGGAGRGRGLEGIGGRPGLAAVELVEYCPRLDKGGRSAQVAVDLLAATLCGSRDDAQVVAEALDR